MNATAFPRKNIIYSEIEAHTIEKQRKELQLLIGELRDRDRELSEMVLAHQRQLLAWEDDRQKVLTLEERCCKLENELHKRSEVIRTLTKRIKSLECQQNDHQDVLQTAQQQLQEMAQKATQASVICEDLEGKNRCLNNSVMELSAQVGQLQAREQALSTMIKLKDKDIAEAINHITDCSGKFKMLEHALHDAKMVESCIIKEKQDYKQKMKILKFEVNKLKDDLNEKTSENNEQREEIIRLKQEKSYLHDELVFTAEREKRKEQLLDIAKSKQERTDTELHNLRQVYVKQQSDLQFLHFTAENSRDDSRIDDSRIHETSRELSYSDLENNNPKIIKREGNQKIYSKDQESESSQVQQYRTEKGGYDGFKEEKRFSPAFGEEINPGTSAMIPKDILERQRSLLLKEKVHFNTMAPAESKRRGPLGRCTMKAAKSSDSETLPPSREHHHHHHHFGGPDYKHCDLNIYVSPGLSRAKQMERLEMECHDQMEVTESFSQFNEGSLSDSDICESKCCHPSNFIIEAPGRSSVSDVEWMKIFKPSKVERIVRPKTVCTCARNVCGIKYHTFKSPPIAFWHCQHTSNVKTKNDDRFVDFSSDKRHLSTFLPSSRDPAFHHDDCSPTSKLQRLLAESREMVTNLELSTLLPVSPSNPNHSTDFSDMTAHRAALPIIEENSS
ncbi:coiled-coil domain-containing protein 62 isoform X1 [Antechinus flavipes]|uniref:coiled-coil domain-containing protein 62 isoform X1 n=1 Tax=Antechinus flavipes TaxID=38775 RepID=UPI00223682B8|nr:coiled-coil domain-containing protein 62 isoform X1 [Antechinus flavipes]